MPKSALELDWKYTNPSVCYLLSCYDERETGSTAIHHASLTRTPEHTQRTLVVFQFVCNV